MRIDPATRANLELMRTLSGETRGSVMWAIDRTVSGPGRRLLADRLMGPLTDVAAIERRLDAVAFFLDASHLKEDTRTALKRAPDIARALSRLAVERGGPRDLRDLGMAMRIAVEIAQQLETLSLLPGEVEAALADLHDVSGTLLKELEAALVDRPPLLKRDGGFVTGGYASDLDEARQLRDDSRQIVAQLQVELVQELSLKSLKIRHNNILGWFIEVPSAQAGKLTRDPARFIHRQTMADSMRFSTAALADLESRIAEAGERALTLELEIFETLRTQAVAEAEALQRIAAALAALDVAAALATLAEERNYSRPTVSTENEFAIDAGRHPVVEQALDVGNSQSFVPNDVVLSPPIDDPTGGGAIWLVTGPNMAGKSTFLRQTALIALLAQIGAFVPARAARIGVVDRLFSRVGAADDLARGRSTFMVEMVETAAILNQAGPRSLVILDEIGRGTATFDGLSIAWAAIEHLHEVNRSRALFATHYHELTALAGRLTRAVNTTVRVREWKGDIVFLHEIAPGAADRSYGIQVARLAGLPSAVVERAHKVLAQLEAQNRANPGIETIDDLPLFAAAARQKAAASPHESTHPQEAILEEIAALAVDEMTPRAALDLLYRLKARLAQAQK